MNTVYRIAKWPEVFERAESRKLKTLTWVSMPVSFASNGFQLMLDEFGDDAPAIYGAWCALVAVAASCTVRGTLGTSRGIPLTTSHIARMIGFPSPIIGRMMEWASKPEVGWLVPASDDENHQNPLQNDDSGDHRGLVGGSSGEFPDYQTGPDPTRPNTTGPDQTRARPRESSSVCRSVVDWSVVEFGQVVRKASQVRKALPVPFDEAESIRYCWIAMAAGCREMLIEAATTSCSDSIKNPKRYWLGAVRKAVEEVGFCFADCLAACRLPEPKRAQPA